MDIETWGREHYCVRIDWKLTGGYEERMQEMVEHFCCEKKCIWILDMTGNEYKWKLIIGTAKEKRQWCWWLSESVGGWMGEDKMDHI